MKSAKSYTERLTAIFLIVFLLVTLFFWVGPADQVLAGHDRQRNRQSGPGDEAFSGRFGINNINRTWVLVGDIILDPDRTQKAQDLGVTWNRVNLWWHDVEQYNGYREDDEGNVLWDQQPHCPGYPGDPDDPSGYLPTAPITWNWDRYHELLRDYSPTNTLFILQGVPQCWQKRTGPTLQDREVYPALLDEPIFEHPGFTHLHF